MTTDSVFTYFMISLTQLCFLITVFNVSTNNVEKVLSIPFWERTNVKPVSSFVFRQRNIFLLDKSKNVPVLGMTVGTRSNLLQQLNNLFLQMKTHTP